MAINGAGIFDTNGLVHIRWGSNFTALTLSGDWWRLITNVFIHFGILHIIMNSYALYMAGVYLEPMLGKIKFTVAYLCTGVLASIASLWWHKEGVNSAGASGAIFGMYGVFLALLFTNLIPKKTRASLLQTIVVFVVYNLMYGMKSGVDNAAHTGGLLSGLLIGLIYYPGLKKGVEENKNVFSAFAITVVTIAFGWIYLNGASSSVSESEVKEARNLMQITAFKDGEKLIEKINEFAAIEEKALAPLNDTTLSNAELSKKLNEISVPEWNKISAILAEAKEYKISENDKKKVELLTEYVTSRKEEITIIERIAETEKQEDYDLLSGVREKISGLITRLRELK
jgi:rhomboid protease GluP